MPDIGPQGTASGDLTAWGSSTVVTLHTWLVFPDHPGKLPADRTRNGEREAFKAQETAAGLGQVQPEPPGSGKGPYVDGLSTEAPDQAEDPERSKAGSATRKYREVDSTPI